MIRLKKFLKLLLIFKRLLIIILAHLEIPDLGRVRRGSDLGGCHSTLPGQILTLRWEVACQV